MSESTTNEALVGAGAAGGGLGTLLVAAAQPLPEGWRSFVSLSAPIVAVGISGTWLFVKSIYLDPFVRRKKDQVAREEQRQLLAALRSQLAEMAESGRINEERRKELEAKVRELENMQFDHFEGRMRILVQASPPTS